MLPKSSCVHMGCTRDAQGSASEAPGFGVACTWRVPRMWVARSSQTDGLQEAGPLAAGTMPACSPVSCRTEQIQCAKISQLLLDTGADFQFHSSVGECRAVENDRAGGQCRFSGDWKRSEAVSAFFRGMLCPWGSLLLGVGRRSALRFRADPAGLRKCPLPGAHGRANLGKLEPCLAARHTHVFAGRDRGRLQHRGHRPSQRAGLGSANRRGNLHWNSGFGHARNGHGGSDGRADWGHRQLLYLV